MMEFVAAVRDFQEKTNLFCAQIASSLEGSKYDTLGPFIAELTLFLERLVHLQSQVTNPTNPATDVQPVQPAPTASPVANDRATRQEEDQTPPDLCPKIGSKSIQDGRRERTKVLPVQCRAGPTIHAESRRGPPVFEPAPAVQCQYNDILDPDGKARMAFRRDREARRRGYVKLHVADLPPVKIDQCRQPGAEHDVWFFYRVRGGMMQVTKSTKKTKPQRCLSSPPPVTVSYTGAELREMWESGLQNPPSDPVAYIIGPPLIDGLELDPGETLRRKTKVPGVNTTYHYWNISLRPAYTALHMEDIKTHSLNATSDGPPKLWLFIQSKWEGALVRRLQSEFGSGGNCSQKVRHFSVVLSPSKLEEWGIPYWLDYTPPGYAIETLEGTLHQCMTLPGNFAAAINYQPKESPDIPPGYVFCDKKCSPYPITEALWGGRLDETDELPTEEDVPRGQKRKRPSDASTEAARRASERASDELEQVKRDIRKCDSLCSIPCLEDGFRPSPQMLKLAAAIRSKSAMLQFIELIQIRRRPDTDASRLNTSTVEGCLSVLSRPKTPGNKFSTRLGQLKLARLIENKKHNALRADSTLLQHTQKSLDMEESQFKHHLKKGRKWARICGKFDGLLCFLFLGKNKFKISPASYIGMEVTDISVFHRLLNDDFTRQLCAAGKAFQDSFASDDVEFLCEGPSIDFSKLGAGELLRLIQPFPSVLENQYVPTNYPNWPRPRRWPTKLPWPTNPTIAQSCDLCSNEACDCIQTVFRQPTPRIKRYPGKGLGLQAVAAKAGERAYEKGDLIGCCLFEIVPPGTYTDDRTIEFSRPDLRGTPIVCQLHCASQGNYFRLLNHSCRPVAKLCQLIISQRCHTVAVAAQDIYDGTEITIHYGNKPPDCACEKCRPGPCPTPLP